MSVELTNNRDAGHATVRTLTLSFALTTMSSGAPRRRNNEHQQAFTRQGTILRKNLYEWDRMLRTPRGEDWPTMVGRLNAALVRKNLRCDAPRGDSSFAEEKTIATD